MAERVVVVGGSRNGVVPCLELSVSDASACRDSGMCRPTLTLYGDELANATIMHFATEYLEALDPHAPDFEAAWKALLALPRHPRHEPFELNLGGPRTGTVRSHELGENWTAEHHLGVEPA